MRPNFWGLAAVLLTVGVTVVLAAPTVRNNVLRLHVQTEASFPAADESTTGGFLFGNTVGVPYWSPGDGGSWQTFGVSAPYTRTTSGITNTQRQESEGTKVFFADAGTEATTGSIIIVNTQALSAGRQSCIMLAEPDPTGAITPGGTVGFTSQSPTAGTTGHVDVHAAVGRGVRLSANGTPQLDCHGGSCGIGGTSTLGNPAQYTLALQDIGAGDTLRLAVTSGNDAVQVSTNGGRVHFGTGANDYCASDGTNVTFAGPIALASTANANTVTIGGGGTVTATVRAGSHCNCTYSTVGVIILLCNVAGTTLTITGTVGADVTYICV